jgi:acyl-CoA thioester hydrolase
MHNQSYPPLSKITPAFRWCVRIYYEDTDAGGVVYHANYLRFMERARTEWLRQLGLTQTQLRHTVGVLFVSRWMEIKFIKSVYLDDEIQVVTALSSHTKASLNFNQQIVNDDQETVCCTCDINIASIDAETRRPVRLPQSLLDRLQRPALN